MTCQLVAICTPHLSHADINTLHWGASNSLAVGLGATVYIWNAETGSINELHRLPFAGSYVTSLQWDARGKYLAIGTSDAEVQVTTRCAICDEYNHIVMHVVRRIQH